MNGIAHLKGTVKHYDWGGTHFIPSLLLTGNPGGKPFAEYWLGIHPLSDCLVEWNINETILLRDLINTNAERSLGSFVYQHFGNLPYLLKALDVKDMLSIQVHPTKIAAEKEFARENAEGIPTTSDKRNYKDDNHKPELMVALGEFWLLHGFKAPTLLLSVLKEIEELNGLIPTFNEEGYQGLYRKIMEMPQEAVNKTLKPLLNRIIPLYNSNSLDKSQEDFWAARAALTFSKGSDIDRGIFSIYLFNLLKLQKGEAIFQAAGIPHAYLEGQNVEIMANSDNVLRGGLTSKHVDVKELMKHVKCEPTNFEILKGAQHPNNEKLFRTPAPDFELSCFDLDSGESSNFISTTSEILLLTEGNVRLSAGKEVLELRPGLPAAIVFPDQQVKINALKHSLLFRATVPVLRE